jgi:hypothetical protein
MEDWGFAFFVALAFASGVWIEDRIYRSRLRAHATSLMTEVIRICPGMAKVFHDISQPVRREFNVEVHPDEEPRPTGVIPGDPRPP